MLAVMFAAFLVQIVFRYPLNFPIGWTNELSVILWLWLVLFGAAFVVTRERGDPLRPHLRRGRPRGPGASWSLITARRR